MRPLIIPIPISAGYFAASPDFTGDDVGISLSSVVGWMPIYNDDETNDFDFVQPLVSGWDGWEHPNQLIKRPNSMFVDKYGRVGDEAAAMRLFQNSDRRIRTQQIGRRYARYKIKLLTAPLSTDADGQIYFTKHQ